jgi:hypothetical protein
MSSSLVSPFFMVIVFIALLVSILVTCIKQQTLKLKIKLPNAKYGSDLSSTYDFRR